MPVIDALFFWVRSGPFFYRLTVLTRVLLAAGFIPTGMVKLLGNRFTLVSAETPIGAFFEAMYQTGLYWQFLGLTQVVAGLLLLLPRTAHLGAAIFLGVILNVFVITISLGFRGTPIIVGLMLLAVAYLCLWDFHRFRSLFTLAPLAAPVLSPRLDRWERVGFLAFAFSLMNFFGVTRSLIGNELALVFLGTAMAAGIFTLGRFIWLRWRGVVAA